MTAGPRVEGLLSELDRERSRFISALDALPDPEATTIIEGWDGRDLVVHAAFWSEHGAEAVELAAAGRGDAFDYDSSRTDDMNAATTAAGRSSNLAQARAREEAAFARFRRVVAAVDEDLLDLRLGNGDPVEAVIRYDGPDHYAEHAAHLRAAARS